MRQIEEKYGFHHVEGAGLARCPFFGLWICGGFGEAGPQMMRVDKYDLGFAKTLGTTVGKKSMNILMKGTRF